MNGKDRVDEFRVLYCSFPNPLKDQEERMEDAVAERPR